MIQSLRWHRRCSGKSNKCVIRKRGGLTDTRDSPTITDDCSDDRVVVVEALGLLKVGRVQILGAMGKEVETCSTSNQPFPQASAAATHQP